MPQFTDVMVDIETTGTQPDRAAIIQIAAVRFNIDTKEVDHDFFNRCLRVPPHRFWSESTMHWWNKQKPGVLREIMEKAEDHNKVINDFADWGYKVQGLRFWAKPTTFDFMFCASYFSDAGLVNPFSYRKATDQNSFLRGLYFPDEVPELNVPMIGDAHNALNDTLWQIETVFEHLKAKGYNNVP